MAYNLDKPISLLVSCFLLVSSLKHFRVHGIGEPQVPCYFIFGDSLSDAGNNNNLQTLAKVNYPPYGIDFLKGPTPSGRFTNGRTFVDIIAESLGFEDFIPPFATATGQEILKGVNYASGSAGIRNETGIKQGDRINMSTQLQNHKITVSRMNELLKGNISATQLLRKCMYTVAIGSNDFLNNYFKPELYPTSSQLTPQQYAKVLVQQLSHHLMVLYADGARKVAVFGAGLIGCTPYALGKFHTNGSLCVDPINNAALLFNARLKSAINDLNANLTGAKFTFIDTFSIGMTSTLKDVSANTPCCKVNEGDFQCIANQPACANRSAYLFWDAVHPTERAATSLATRAFKAETPTDAYPFDISKLAEL